MDEEVLDQEVGDIDINFVEPEDEGPGENAKPIPTGRDWEQEASTMGWNSEYDGDDAIDAREYVLRKPIFDNLKKVKRKARDLEAALQSQQKVMNAIIEKQKKEEATAVEKRRQAAIDEGDLEKAFTYDAELKEINSAPSAPATPATNPVFETWLEQNHWYEDDEDARLFADAYADRVASSTGGDLDEILHKTTERVSKRFPELFKSRRTQRVSDVETSQTRGKAPRKSGSSFKTKIPKDFRRVAESQIASGAFGDVSKEAGYEAYYEGLLAAGIVDEDE